MSEQSGVNSPHLDKQERKQAQDNTNLSALVIHEIVRGQGEQELERSFGGLAWSGLAAGLSIGFSFLAQSYLQGALPHAPWARLVSSFGYCLGFLIVLLGQQQLYTETTLTALIPALTRRNFATLLSTLRVWGVVIAANLVGTWIFAAVAAQPGIFSPAAYNAMSALSAEVMAHPFWQTATNGVFAGWLIGLMVWLLPGAGPARPLIIILLTYIVAVCAFPHSIAGSVESAYGVFTGHASVGDYLWRFFAPTFLGNTVAGTALVALLNHAPIAGELDGSRGRDRVKHSSGG